MFLALKFGSDNLSQFIGLKFGGFKNIRPLRLKFAYLKISSYLCIINLYTMTQDERWQAQYDQMMAFKDTLLGSIYKE